MLPAGFLAAVDDFDAAFADLSAATDEVVRRRALRAGLGCLYEMRTYREGRSKAEQRAYRRLAAESPAGMATEALVLLRGIAVHDIARDVRPEMRTLYPGDNLYPGERTYPGSNLVWKEADELPIPAGKPRDPRPAWYRERVAGRPALEGLADAREFLVTTAGGYPRR